MAFPQTPLDTRVEMKLPGWTQVQASPTGVRGDPGITITRGRANEQASGSQQPSTCSMSLNNRDGRYSPRNPLGTYYGALGRNTQVRVSTPGDGTTSCRIPGNYGADYVSCPDATGLHITGDIDVRIDVTLDNILGYQTLAAKGDWGSSAASNLGWIVFLDDSGTLRWAWSTSGAYAGASVTHATTNLTASQSRTRLALRVTMAVASGTVTFYTASTISGSWTQLGSTQVLGATSIFASTAAIQLGEFGSNAISLNSSIMSGRLNAFQLLSGIAGTAKANPDFTAQSLGATSFADTVAAPNTWTLNGDCEITNRRYRFHGEISSFPQRWDISGRDVWTPIQAAGILRRWGQGSEAVTSPIRKAVMGATVQPVVYWPCEDPTGSASFAVAAGSGNPMLISGSPTLATDTHIGGSSALPTLGNSIWTGTIPAYTASSPNAVEAACVLYMPTAPATGTPIMSLTAGNTRFDLGYSTAGGGGVYVNAYDTTTGSLVGVDNSGSPTAASTATAYMVAVTASQSGTSINYGLIIASSGTSSTTTAYTALTSRTLSKMAKIVINSTAGLSDTVVGHVAVWASQPATLPQQSALTGNTGEHAGVRFRRLCFENGIQPRLVGDPTDSPVMGAQGSDTLINLLQGCVDADGGIMHEPRDVLGLGLVCRSGLYAQASAVTLSISSNQLSAVPEPVEDDQLVRNFVTVNRTGGSYASATLETGALSVQDPPDGVGVYSDDLTINYQTDAQLLDEASWRMHVGTVDEARWPVVTTNMASNQMVASSTLAQQVQACDVGQMVTITGLPAWVQPDDARQLIQGVTETLSNFQFEIAFNCSPASPYDVLILDDTTFSRVDADGSTLVANISSGATSFDVTTPPTSASWTTSGGDLPVTVEVGGEQMTVTASTGAASDAFGRTVSNGWGTADVGGAWTTTGGSASDYSVGAGVGVHALNSVNVFRWSLLPTSYADVDVYATFSLSATLTGAGGSAGLVARYVDSSNYYVLRAEANTDNTLTITLRKVVAGVGTQLDGMVASGLTVGAGTQFRMRLQAAGSGLKGKVWLASAANEPDWQAMATDTAFTAAGLTGIRSILDTGNTNALPVNISYDNLSMVNPQKFTVTRGANGITKAHTAGDAVALARPFYLSI